MEKHRRQLMQDKRFWGDLTPREPAKSGSLPRGTLDPCLAAYRASAARFENSAMKSILPQQPLISAKRQSISAQGWSLDYLVSKSLNFKPVRRISALNKAALNPAELEKYDKGGVPLIIEHFHRLPRWPQQFNLKNFESHGPSKVSVRNVLNGADTTIPTSEFIDKCRASSTSVSEHDQERLYGKDVECPEEWQKLLGQFGIPTHLMPGSDHDLLSNQPSQRRVKTLMCYLGIGDTFTPCHKDLCASSGQNLMCYTENGGSSFWFMTATEDVFEATTYFRGINKELDLESSVVTVEELSKAPFTVYIAEQKLGDLVLVPSRSCHQVINQGGITIKTSWSRMTLDGLVSAYYHELPIYQRICRAETYRVKYTIYLALKNFIKRIRHLGQKETSRERLLNGLRLLLEVYDDVLSNENCHPGVSDKLSFVINQPDLPSSSSDDVDDTGGDRITCDFCEAEIFQSFFECQQCVENPARVTPGDGCTICPRCYTDGRSCQCGSMNPMQCRPFSVLLKTRDEAAGLLKKLGSSQLGNKTNAEEKLNKLGVFAAGCLKNKTSDFDATRKCSAQGVVHDVRKFNSLFCYGCHKSSCFQHILSKYDTHAVDALLDSASSDKQQYHKKYHSSDRSCFSEPDLIQFAESVKHGSCPDARFQRYHITAFHTKCLPATKYVRCGYYDEGWDGTERYASTLSTDKEISHENLVPTARSSPLSSISEYEQQLTSYFPSNGSGMLAEEPPRSRENKRLVLDCVEIPKPLDKRKWLSNVKPSVVTRSQALPEIETSISSQACSVPSSNKPELMDSETPKQASPPAYVANAMEIYISTNTTDVYVDEGEQEQRWNRSEEDIIPMDINADVNDISTNELSKVSYEGSGPKIGFRDQDFESRKRRPKMMVREVTPRTTTKTQSLFRNKQTARKKAGERTRTDISEAGTSRPEPANENVWQMLAKGPTVPSSSEDYDTTTASHLESVAQSKTPEILPTNHGSAGYGSDTAVASQSPMSETPPIRAKGPGKPARVQALPEESISVQYGSKFVTRNETGRKKDHSTMTRSRSTSTTGPSIASVEDESARPSKRPRLDSSGAGPSRRGRKKIEDEMLNDYGPDLAAALTTASSANQNSPAKRKGRVQAEMNDRTPIRDRNHPIRECSQPSLTTESKEEYERKIRELESRLMLVEAQSQPKHIADQVIDAVVHRMKEVMPGFPHAMTPQPVYLAPISVGPLIGSTESGLDYFPMSNGQHNYRANHNGNPRFHSHQPNFQSGWNPPRDPYWRNNHHLGPRQDFRNRPPITHHNNNSQSYTHRPIHRFNTQRGRQRHGGFYNREAHSSGEMEMFNNRRYDDNSFRSPHSEDSEQQARANESSLRMRPAPTMVGLSDLDRKRVDAVPGASERPQHLIAFENTTETSSGTNSKGTPPRRHLTPPYSEQHITPRSDMELQCNQVVTNSENPSRPNDELTSDWEEGYDLDNGDGDANRKGNQGKAPTRTTYNNVLESNPWSDVPGTFIP